jgi:uncharacterized damage-inducible protein DinB
MQTSLMNDAFAHHVWATLRVLDACEGLTSEQLNGEVPGTYGSIIDTLRHLVGADAWYLYVIGGGTEEPADTEDMSISELRAAMALQGEGWHHALRGDLDPGRYVIRVRGDGSESHAPLGIRLAQVVHHGTDHRSQICTALTGLGIDPPAIDVWDFGAERGRVYEVRPDTQLNS